MNDKELLREIAAKLEQMANESQYGGWSTHQVKPQLELARKIYAHLGRKMAGSWSAQDHLY